MMKGNISKRKTLTKKVATISESAQKTLKNRGAFSVPIIGICTLIFGVFKLYEPTLYFQQDYGVIVDDKRGGMTNSEDNSTRFLLNFNVLFINKGWRSNRVETIVMVPLCEDSMVQLSEKVKMISDNVGFRSKQIVSFQLFFTMKELIIEKDKNGSYILKSHPFKLFFLDRFGNQVHQISDEGNDGFNCAFEPDIPVVMDLFNEKFKLGSLPIRDKYYFSFVCNTKNGTTQGNFRF